MGRGLPRTPPTCVTFGVGRRGVDEAGYTLVELLVAMALALVVLAAGTYGIATAFQQSTEVTGRTESTNQAEVGLQRLAQDLRFATVCPNGSTNTLGAGGEAVDGLLLSAGPTLQLCEPVAGAHASQPPALALVSWTCDMAAGAQSCTRSWAPIDCPSTSGSTAAATGTCESGAPTEGSAQGSTSISGVTAVTIFGTVAGASQTSLLSDASCEQVAAGASYWAYQLTSGDVSVDPCPITWIGLKMQLVAQTTSGAAGSSDNANLQKKTSPIEIQTGVALRNFGT